MPRVAPQTGKMAPRHEVSRAACGTLLNEKLPIRANSLKTMMIDNNGFSRHQAEQQRHKIGAANKSPQAPQARLPHDLEWQATVVPALLSSRLGHQRKVESFLQLRQTASQCQHDRLDAADTWREVVGIDKQVHFETPGNPLLFSSAALRAPAPFRDVANCRACIIPSMFSRGDQVSTCAFAHRLKCCLCGKASIFSSDRAKASTSTQGKISPVSPGLTRSRPAPTRSLTIAGHPQQKASFTTSPKGSYSDGSTNTSEAA